jgi:hypothetical protein
MNSYEQTDLVWHYTSAEGLQGILQGHTLRATSAAFMNDSNELRSGARAFKEHYERRKGELSQRSQQMIEHSGAFGTPGVHSSFLLSASQHRDSLTMWRNYGGDAVSYAIGLDRREPLSPLEHISGDTHPTPPADFYNADWEELGNGERHNLNPSPDALLVIGRHWQNLTYISGADHDEVKAQFDHIASRLEASAEDRLLYFWMFPEGPLSLMKDVGFQDEAEVRMILSTYPQWKFVQHRPSRFGLIPFIELATTDADRDYASTRSLLPIREIMIGPTPVRADAELSLRMFLDNAGYGAVSIGSSAIPFR